jgi:hypothetical protein
MERLTSNKEVSDMSMIELAHNSCYADDKRNARYRDYDLDIDSRKLVRNLMKDMCDEDLSGMSDEEFDEYMGEMLSVEMDSQVGLLALFYRNLWAMANLRETLKKYEDLEGQGRMIIFPCNKGDKIYEFYRECVECRLEAGDTPEDIISTRRVRYFGYDGDEAYIYASQALPVRLFNNDEPFCIPVSEIGKTVFLSYEEAEAKLKELRGNNG